MEALITLEDFWKNKEEAEKTNKEAGVLRDEIKKWKEIENNFKYLKDLFGLEDASVYEEISEKLNRLKNDLRVLEKERFLGGKYDKSAAILSIHAGAGGDDAEDWAGMLAEMYANYAKSRNWDVKILDENFGSYAGKTGRRLLKDITLLIDGKFAYGYLKREAGVHRLVRISPFSAKHLRHTSFAYVEALPELKDIDEQSIIIKSDNIKVEMFRSSGPGGQNVNKRETAVRVTHIPTGVSAACQSERLQGQNKEKAIAFLRSKLFHLLETRKKKEISELKGAPVKIEWGHQIRSYVLHPYHLVKDHRTEFETAKADDVLAGKIDDFIEYQLRN